MANNGEPTTITPPPTTVLSQLPRSLPVYHKILVNTSGSQSLRVTFDACEGSDENHYWDHHNGFTDTHVTELFNLEFNGQGSIPGFQLEEEFELELRRTLLSDVQEPRLEPVLISEQELTTNVGLLPVIANNISFEVKIASFMPGLSQFQNKWYLTVIEDSVGVRLHPRFLPATENNKSGSDVWHTTFTLTENQNTSTWALSFKADNTGTYYQLVPSTTRIETQQFTSAEPTEYSFAFGIDIV